MADLPTLTLKPAASPAEARRSVNAQSPNPQSVSSVQLFQGRKELWIQHGDQRYRLCHTRNDKLILVK
ncbi:hemin uptake protein HemP [Arenimonas sp.]|uniref:hemin uptake protein HemP n=1 Tax=Arenimonas sp. TaxID=1872635 RepID=UPI0039E42607